MRQLYNSRAFWLVLSLLLALAMWSYVASLNADEFKQTFRGVRVEIVGDDIIRNSRDLVVIDVDTNSVDVEIVGPRRVVAALSSSDLVAQVDVSKLTQAAYTSQPYTIVFPDGTEASSLRTSSKTPETVNFMVSKLSSKTVQVRGSFEGSLADGYSAETPVFEPSTITIYGAETYIRNVDYAWVTFGKENVDQTYFEDTGFVLMDKDAEECSLTGITFSNDVIRATLPILEIKEVPLYVNLIEGSGATAENTKIKIEPETITLVGDSAILAGLNRITLATIDLTDFAASISEVYPIAIDEQLQNLTGITEAKVTVEIVGLETKTFTVDSSNISCTNVTEGYEADILTNSLVVTLRGPADRLSEVKSENIRAVADLLDYKNSIGTFMPEVRIYVDGFTDVGAVGNTTITVELKRS